MNKHFLSINDIENAAELKEILELAATMKKERGTSTDKPLTGKAIGMIFMKSSTRTRVSFEIGINELGAQPIFLSKNDIQLGRSESMADTGEVLSRYLHGVVMRANGHDEFMEYVQHSKVPVINALTDKYHPCQLLADLQTVREQFGRTEGIKVAFLGDGASNMAHSWILAASLAGMDLRIGAPEGYQPFQDVIDSAKGTGTLTVTDDPFEAAKDADVIYTDVWVSMGFEEEAKERLDILKPYQVNDKLMAVAKPSAKVMHCLPAYRGKEITASVLDGPQSVIWDEAENRLHAQKAVMKMLFS